MPALCLRHPEKGYAVVSEEGLVGWSGKGTAPVALPADWPRERCEAVAKSIRSVDLVELREDGSATVLLSTRKPPTETISRAAIQGSEDEPPKGDDAYLDQEAKEWLARQKAKPLPPTQPLQRPGIPDTELGFGAAVDGPSYYGGKWHPCEAVAVVEHHRLGFHEGNAVCYVMRAGKKPGESYEKDIKKAIWYLERALKVRAGAGKSVIPKDA